MTLTNKGLTGDMSLVLKNIMRYTNDTDRTIAAMGEIGLEYINGSWHRFESFKENKALITKSSDDKNLVFGWANVVATEDDKVVLDKQRDFIDDAEEIEKAAYDYMLTSRDAGAEHLVTGVGKAVESVVFTKEKQAALGIPTGVVPVGWWIGFKVEDSDVWELVKSGKFKAFSVHGTGKRTPVKQS